MEPNLIYFDHPMNETMRVLLRVEELQLQIKTLSQDTHPHANRAALRLVVELAILLDRTDLRARFTKKANRFLSNLERLQKTPLIDYSKLEDTTSRLTGILKQFHGDTGKFAQRLRENYFIKSI